MKIAFGEPDNMLKLAAAAIAPTAEGDKLLTAYFQPEGIDSINHVRSWMAQYRLPANTRTAVCEDAESFKRELADADIAVVEKQPLTAGFLDGAPALKRIVLFGRGLSGIDVDACARRGIAVETIDRLSNRWVVEQTLLLMLALTHRLDETRRGLGKPSSLAPSGWAYNWTGCGGVRGLAGRTIGLVGFGEIGQLMAEYLQPFRARVLYTRRHLDPRTDAKSGARFADLKTLVTESDIISIHVPGTAENRHLLSAELLAVAKPGVLIVNTGRGLIIDEGALAEGLRTRRIGGAGLDVFITEPLPMDHPFRQLDNVILTPHVAGGTRDALWLDREIGPIVRAIIEVGRTIGA